ncbi:putative orphan protein [Pseudoalteromonas luteoviolacea B = ATCC 29581]|nr:putative orphan protein [Pseudoalteromonas luteoviolacea B = ATCC 29581]
MLSRAGWNNVVIFTMLAMIFFLNGLHHKLFDKEQIHAVLPVLPESSFVLAAEIPGVKIERIGTSWRTEGIWQANTNEIESWLSSWLEYSRMTVEPPSLTSQPLSIAQFWLAGYELPWVIRLYQQDHHFYFHDKQRDVWFEMTSNQVSTMFAPIALIKE